MIPWLAPKKDYLQSVGFLRKFALKLKEIGINQHECKIYTGTISFTQYNRSESALFRDTILQRTFSNRNKFRSSSFDKLLTYLY